MQIFALGERAQHFIKVMVAHAHAQPGSRDVGRLFTSLVMNEPTFYAAFTFRRFLISLKPTERHRVTARSPLSNLPRTDRGFCNEATVGTRHRTAVTSHEGASTWSDSSTRDSRGENLIVAGMRLIRKRTKFREVWKLLSSSS